MFLVVTHQVEPDRIRAGFAGTCNIHQDGALCEPLGKFFGNGLLQEMDFLTVVALFLIECALTLGASRQGKEHEHEIRKFSHYGF